MIRTILFTAYGLVFGSFLTVVVHRVPRKESVAEGRSRCPSCGAQIRARDNVPVVSYLLLRGRCRACKARISPVYPLLELATAGLAAGASLAFQRTLPAVLVALFLSTLLAVAAIDAVRRIIPNRIVYPALLGFGGAIAVGAVTGAGVDGVGALVGLLSFGGAFLVVALLSPRGMGMGDVKLAALIGLVLGAVGLRLVVVAAGAAILLGGLGAIVALAMGRTRKQALPFGPYLAAGAGVAAFFGREIAAAYLRLLS